MLKLTSAGWAPAMWHATFRQRSVILFACAALLAGCTADPNRMVVSSGQTLAAMPSAWQANLCLRNVTGGEQWTLMSQPGLVEDAALRTALENTLQQNDLAAPPGGCHYFLDVDILGISQPSHGLFVTSVRTDSHMNYKIYDPDHRPAFIDTVSTSYTEPFLLLPAVARVQRSSEGAVRTNFEQFLQHLVAKQPSG